VTWMARPSRMPNRGDVAAARRGLSATRPIPRRGLSRDEAAIYVGISSTKFDELVRDRRMPGARRIDSRRVWDVHALDLAFDQLPCEDGAQGTSWDDV
jgi:hypothetical protein